MDAFVVDEATKSIRPTAVTNLPSASTLNLDTVLSVSYYPGLILSCLTLRPVSHRGLPAYREQKTGHRPNPGQNRPY
jgi:hypothetical protein